MIGLAELRRKAAESRLGMEVIERDYVLGWLLWGLFAQPALREEAVFKGGTALRKAYFADYRFSQDVDLTLRRSVPADELEAMLNVACREVVAESGVYLSVARFEVERDQSGEETYSARIAYVGPRQQQRNPARLKVDMTAYEQIVLAAEMKPLLHPYSDRCEVTLPTYRLEEMLAETLSVRALLTRRRVRHFHDVWYLLKHRADDIDGDTVLRAFAEKCRYKHVPFESPADFFRPGPLAVYAALWEKSLIHQLSGLPDFASASTECRQLVEDLFDAPGRGSDRKTNGTQTDRRRP